MCNAVEISTLRVALETEKAMDKIHRFFCFLSVSLS